MKGQILFQLAKGKAHATPGKLLAQRLGVKDTRQIRLSIIDLIEEGYPICSSTQKPYGYFLAENKVEIQQSLEQLRSYIIQLARHYKYLRKSAKHFVEEKQLSLKL